MLKTKPQFYRRVSTVLWVLLCGFLISTPTHAENDSVRSRIKIKKKTQVLRRNPAEENNEEYNAERADILARKRKALILDIRRFIQSARGEDQKAELNLRLGGLYMEDYYAGLAKAQQNFEKDSVEFAKGTKKKKGRPPKLDNSEAYASLDRARVIYKDLVARYPKHPRRDEMLYFLAISALDKSLTKEGMGYFERLSRETPNSKYLNDALVQLGDYYFDQNKWPMAEGYYDKIIQKRYRPLIGYVIYKKAWCSYNQQRTEMALKQFKYVIDSEEEEANAQVRIKAEALRDITLPFVDLRLLNESIAFFKAHGEPYYRRGLETMAALYSEQGQYPSAVTLWEELLTIDPNFAKNPTYDLSIVESYKTKGDNVAAVQRLFARLPGYMENSNWYEINAQNPTVIKEAARSFEETARKYAFQFHAEGQKTKNDRLYNVAKQLYAKYLEYFPRTTQSAQVRFYLAEILYKQEDYWNAASNYFQVYKDPQAGNLRLDSIRYALTALDRQLNAERKKQGLAAINSKMNTKLKAKEDATPEATPFTEPEGKFVEISMEYLTQFPGAKDAPDVLYEQAYLHYMHYDLVKAYKSFWHLVQKYPTHATAYSSAYLILDILNRKKDYPKLIASCQKFLQNASFGKSDFRTQVADILRHSELKRIQLVEEKGSFKEAADAYLEYTKAYGHQDEQLFEKALYNAAVDYQKALMYLAAVETQEKFLRRFPKSNLRENLLLQVAKTYETLANFEKAGYYFEQFVTTYPKNPQAKPAMRLAGLYYWGSGNARRGETVMLGYLRTYPADKMVQRDLLSLYESQGSHDKQISYYMAARAERGVTPDDYLFYTLRVSELAMQKNGQMPPKIMDDALRAVNKFGKELAQTPRGIEGMSKTLFWHTKQREEYFTKIKLTLPQAQLEANLQKKMQLLKDLEKDYARVVGLGSGEWGLASIYKTAYIYQHMAQEVAQAPVPAELSAEQVEMYRGEIQKQMIKPFNERALNMAASCLDKAQEFNLISSWTPKCYALASELEPNRYPLVRTFFLPPLQTALIYPSKEESKITMGTVKSYAYPFYSSGMFTPGNTDRATASIGPSDIPSLYEGGKIGHDTGQGIIPTLLTYRNLGDERKRLLKDSFEREKPSDSRKSMSFGFLNLVRFSASNRAIPLVLEALQKDPNNQAIHNLLGLTYLELGNLPSAKVVWLAMVAGGAKNAAIWNNLGVVSMLEGNETSALDYFHEATLMENPREALSNLGFLALKYRNGFEAKKHFEKALTQEREDVSARVGLAVAQLQNREMEAAKDSLADLSKKFKSDPYARLSLGYFLIDVEKENELANKILTEYMEAQALEGDLLFRQAIQETKRVAGRDSGSLPTIDQ